MKRASRKPPTARELADDAMSEGLRDTVVNPRPTAPASPLGKDRNHRLIVNALRASGASVVDLSAVGGGVPDLLVGRNGATVLLELKDGTAKPSQQRLRPSQVQFFEKWRGGPAHVVKSVDEALRVVAQAVHQRGVP